MEKIKLFFKNRVTIILQVLVFISIIFSPLITLAKGRIIVIAGNIYQYQNGSWENKIQLSYGYAYFGRQDLVIFEIRSNKSPRKDIQVPKGVTWGYWDINSDSIQFFRAGLKNLNPRQILSDGTIIYQEYKFRGIFLYTQSPGKRIKLIYRSRGMGDFEYRNDKSHIFYIIPKMGKKESHYFIDYVLNSPATIYYVKGGSRKKLVTDKTTQNLNFVDSGNYVVYWRPGQVLKEKNKKFWVLESIHIPSGEKKTIAKVSNRIKFGGRGTPSGWFFKNSPWIMFEKRMFPRSVDPEYVVYHVRTGEKKILKISYEFKNAYDKNEIFEPLGKKRGLVFEPYVVGKISDKMVVWSIPDLKVVMEIPFPKGKYYPWAIGGAVYIPD